MRSPETDTEWAALLAGCVATTNTKDRPIIGKSALTGADLEFCNDLVNMLHQGKSAIVIVKTGEGEQLKYFFSDLSRAEAIAVLNRVSEHSANKLK